MNRNNSHKDRSSLSLERNSFFLSKLSGKYVFSSVIAMVFLYAGSLIDTILVGLYLGEEGLAAMSLVSPVYLVFYTVGAVIGIGGSIAASRLLGKEDPEPYQKLFSTCVDMMVVASLAMLVLSYIFVNPITSLLTGNGTAEQKALVKSYLVSYFPGGAFNMLAYIPLYFLKVEGQPKHSSRLFAFSAATNVVLSWLFISPLCNMGIFGAGFATSISMVLTAVFGFVVLLTGKNRPKSFAYKKKCFTFRQAKHIFTSGAPNGLSNLLESARIFLVNRLLLAIGAAAFLPCYTVVRNVSDLLTSVIIGSTSALLPLIGVFFGERDYDGERSVLKLSKKIGISIMIPLVAVTALLSIPLCHFFGVSDPVLLREGQIAIPLATFGLIIGSLNNLYSGYLTSIKREGTAILLVAFRVFILVALFAIPLAYTLGRYGIWLSLSLAEIASLFVYYIIRTILRKKNPDLDSSLLDTSKEYKNDITFSVRNDVNDIVSASEKISVFCENEEIDMKKSMRVSMAIEEILTFLLAHCLGTEKTNYIDVRVCRQDERVLLRFRYIGEIFDPMSFYRDNEENEEMAEELLGLKMVMKSAATVDFRQTLAANNLLISF